MRRRRTECHSTHTPYGETIAHCPLAMLWTYVRGGRTQRHVARGRGHWHWVDLSHDCRRAGHLRTVLGGGPKCAQLRPLLCVGVYPLAHTNGDNQRRETAKTVRCGRPACITKLHRTYLWLGPTEQPARAVAARRGTDYLLPARAPQRTVATSQRPLHTDHTETAHRHTRHTTRHTALEEI